MSQDDARQLLESVRIMSACVQRRATELERSRALVERMGGMSPDMPVVQGGLPSTGAEWDIYLEAKASYEEALEASSLLRQRVHGILDRMTHVTGARILEMRYLHDHEMSLDQISGKLGISKTHVARLLSQALRDFSNLMAI